MRHDYAKFNTRSEQLKSENALLILVAMFCLALGSTLGFGVGQGEQYFGVLPPLEPRYNIVHGRSHPFHLGDQFSSQCFSPGVPGDPVLWSECFASEGVDCSSGDITRLGVWDRELTTEEVAEVHHVWTAPEWQPYILGLRSPRNESGDATF